eukprot:scaffold699_cov231-Pinguiococcus_pyrenoidosus.AAC.1
MTGKTKTLHNPPRSMVREVRDLDTSKYSHFPPGHPQECRLVSPLLQLVRLSELLTSLLLSGRRWGPSPRSAQEWEHPLTHLPGTPLVWSSPSARLSLSEPPSGPLSARLSLSEPPLGPLSA